LLFLCFIVLFSFSGAKIVRIRLLSIINGIFSLCFVATLSCIHVKSGGTPPILSQLTVK